MNGLPFSEYLSTYSSEILLRTQQHALLSFYCIAAASVLAKVERDAIMREAHTAHPEYGWDGNKGYGAEAHLNAIRVLGPTMLHRRSWSLPVAEHAV